MNPEILTTSIIIKKDPAKVLGLEEGDAHVIRNAGGRVTDALRSIIISQQLLGTREIIIVHHVRVTTRISYHIVSFHPAKKEIHTITG